MPTSQTDSAKDSRQDHEIDFGFDKIAESKKEDKVRAVFDSVAPKYDLMNDILSFGMHRGWKRRCIRETALKTGMKLLDIASGTGDLAIAFSKSVGAESVTATDINYEMLSFCRRRMIKEGLNCGIIQADSERLPFADNTFDRVTVSFGIRNMTHKDLALKGMLRVLKPGGRLLVLEFSRCAPLLKPFYDFYSFKFMPWLGGYIAADADSYRYLAESIRMHPDQKTFAGMMTSAGFVDVAWHNLTFGICALHIGTKPTAGIA